MKFNFTNAVIRNYPSKEPLMEGGKEVTILAVSTMAMMQGNPQEQITMEQKVKKYRLGVKLCSSEEEVELTAEEVAMIKQSVGALWGPLIVGQVVDFYESAGKE